jgi:hypothetical protein
MKLITFLFFLLIANFSLSRRSFGKKKSRKTTFKSFDMSKPILPLWDRQVAEAFTDYAGLGYQNKILIDAQLAEIRKPTRDTSKIGYLYKHLFIDQSWELIYTWQDTTQEHFDYSYSIIKNQAFKKVICSFSGTKNGWQLKEEYHGRSGEAYYLRNEDGKIQIVSYFHQLYLKIKDSLVHNLDIALRGMPSDSQIIFTGHSLGGAMATIALFDMHNQEKIKTTANSPVLITYGQPRTGNYVFANEVFKKAPIIFRHVNDWDPVPGVPNCYKDADNNHCINEYGKTELDKNLSTYTKTLTNSNFYPWHVNGLILSSSSINSMNCGVYSEITSPGCKPSTSLYKEFHLYYYGYQIARIGEPEFFPYKFDKVNDNYDISPNAVKNHQLPLTRDVVAHRFDPWVEKDKSGVMAAMKYHALDGGWQVLKTMGLISKKKKLRKFK